MEIQSDIKDSMLIITVEGRVDIVTAPELMKEGLKLVEQNTDLQPILMMEKVEYISSAGLRTILIIGKKTKAYGRQLIICGMSGVVKEVFEMSGFTAFFQTIESLEDLEENDV